jgi:hypothetical protein
MLTNDCNEKYLNEECVLKNPLSEQGTCQCKLGTKRNYSTFVCESVFIPTSTTNLYQNNKITNLNTKYVIA